MQLRANSEIYSVRCMFFSANGNFHSIITSFYINVKKEHRYNSIGLLSKLRKVIVMRSILN